MSAPVVTVGSGRLAGEERDGVRRFRAIPFAAPPVGALRFAAPRPPQTWTGVRDATRPASPAPQLPVPPGASPTPIGDEDCLYLDVCAPAAPGPHPVLVWIHGGGAVSGGIAECDGAWLARRGVVAVTIAYRLGALGLLRLPGVFEGEPDGNLALLDQLAGLRWVRDEIAAFGGDPARVTLAGLSNGGRTVGTLMATPAADRLFQRAAIMSGTGVGQLVAEPEEAERATAAVLAELGLDRADARRLRDVSAAALVAAQSRAAARADVPVFFQVVHDGQLLPERPLDALARGAGRERPLLIGTTQEEYDGFARHPAFAGAGRSLLLGDDALACAQAAYRALLPDWTDAEVRRRTITDADWWLPAIRMAEAVVGCGGRAWMYRLDWRLAPRGEGFGAPHGLDVPVMSPGHPESDELLALARRDVAPLTGVIGRMQDALAAFASTADARPGWPAYELARRTTCLFDDETRIAEDPQRQLRRVWDEPGPDECGALRTGA